MQVLGAAVEGGKRRRAREDGTPTGRRDQESETGTGSADRASKRAIHPMLSPCMVRYGFARRNATQGLQPILSTLHTLVHCRPRQLFVSPTTTHNAAITPLWDRNNGGNGEFVKKTRTQKTKELYQRTASRLVAKFESSENIPWNQEPKRFIDWLLDGRSQWTPANAG